MPQVGPGHSSGCASLSCCYLRCSYTACKHCAPCALTRFHYLQWPPRRTLGTPPRQRPPSPSAAAQRNPARTSPALLLPAMGRPLQPRLRSWPALTRPRPPPQATSQQLLAPPSPSGRRPPRATAQLPSWLRVVTSEVCTAVPCSAGFLQPAKCKGMTSVHHFLVASGQPRWSTWMLCKSAASCSCRQATQCTTTQHAPSNGLVANAGW
jgi:hypothetical protein